MKCKFVPSLTMVAMSVPAGVALAQDVGLEEIVVTATRREESLQNLANSATVFSAQDLQASGSGASRLALEGLSVGSLEVTLSGASSAQVTADDELSFDLSGASSLQYGGSPTITHQSVTGGSSVNEAGG